MLPIGLCSIIDGGEAKVCAVNKVKKVTRAGGRQLAESTVHSVQSATLYQLRSASY